jgi:hypothetical protein
MPMTSRPIWDYRPRADKAASAPAGVDGLFGSGTRAYRMTERWGTPYMGDFNEADAHRVSDSTAETA